MAPRKHYDLILDLQELHDDVDEEYWEDGLLNLAICCYLNTEVIGEI